LAQEQVEEALREMHIRVLGDALGPIFHALYEEVVWLHAKWLEYRKLYAHSPERIKLLNNQAQFFFRILQDVLWNDVLLHIARVTDRPVSWQSSNATLQALGPRIADEALRSTVTSLVQRAIEASSFAKQWRDKRLAHLDFAEATRESTTLLPPVSRQNVEDALLAIREVMNAVYGHYFDTSVGFEHFLAVHDAELLVYHLRVAARAEQQERARLEAGTPSPEDLAPLPDA
jgi:hypothetical protein